MEKSNNLTVLILAAGSSKRLGEPKQLIRVKDKSLLEKAIENALKLTSSIVVVLGYKSEEIKKEIKDLPISIIVNPNYKEGMGSSISYAMKNIPLTENVLLMLCDQPLIPNSHFEKLIEKSVINKSKIVCSKYYNRFAVPSIFPKKYFKHLIELNADYGARKFLENNPVEFVELDNKLALDIDTLNDKEFYLNIIRKIK